MAISIQILWAVALVALVMWLTTAYWRRVIRKSGHVEKDVPKPRTAVQEQVKQNAYMEWKMQNEHMERMKDRAASQKQTQALKNKVEFMSDVLFEVQRQQLSIYSYMKVLTTVNLQPGQTEWDMVSDQLKERSERLTEMVNDTMELIRYEDLPVVENTDVVPVNTFCQDVLTSCHEYLDKKVDLQLETELEDNETVCTNVNCLQRVLTKLLINSMQFTHEGEIVLSVKHHRQEQNDYLKFVLTDTGQTVPMEMRDLAFDRIPNTEVGTKMVMVRLRLCKALVKLLGGVIYIDTSYEKGTSVVFTIKSQL